MTVRSEYSLDGRDSERSVCGRQRQGWCSDDNDEMSGGEKREERVVERRDKRDTERDAGLYKDPGRSGIGC